MLERAGRRHRQPLRGRRGHPHRREPDRGAPRGVARPAGRRQRQSRGLARQAYLAAVGTLPGRPRAAAAAAGAAGDGRRGRADRHPPEPGDRRRALRRARRRLRTSTARAPRRACRSTPAPRCSIRREPSTTSSACRATTTASTSRPGRRRACRSTPAARNSSLIRQAQQVLEQRKFEVQDAGRDGHRAGQQRLDRSSTSRSALIVANREQVRGRADRLRGRDRGGPARRALDARRARRRPGAAAGRGRGRPLAGATSTSRPMRVLRAMGLLTVEHLNLGIDELRSRRLFHAGAARPVGRLRHRRGRPDPRALGAQVTDGVRSEVRDATRRPSRWPRSSRRSARWSRPRPIARVGGRGVGGRDPADAGDAGRRPGGGSAPRRRAGRRARARGAPARPRADPRRGSAARHDQRHRPRGACRASSASGSAATCAS